MAQARRKQTTKTKKNRQQRSSSGLGMLLTGMVVGCVLTTLFLGWKKDPDHGIGSGINQMIAKSRQQNAELEGDNSTQSQGQTQKTPSYDFYTILPEIEQVIPEEYTAPAAKQKPAESKDAKTTPTQPVAAESDHYLLQAGSFGKKDEANQLKAKLALSGYESYLQKVTVDGKKFYRVRMGPYRNLNKLDAASKDLGTKGINAMRIKVSKG